VEDCAGFPVTSYHNSFLLRIIHELLWIRAELHDIDRFHRISSVVVWSGFSRTARIDTNCFSSFAS
jgi:hypothetical protein